MWTLLIGLIYTFNEISYGDFAPKKQKLWNISEPTNHAIEIRAKRKELEEQHNINYLADEVTFRNWPEVHENSNQDCKRFLKKTFPGTKHLASALSQVRKVILNYKHMKDEDNNIPTAIRVTALECKLHKSLWNRKYIYFIRSPQSPSCALFLNRIGKRSNNFYIVEEICEHNGYPFIRKYMDELEEDKLENSISRPNRRRRQMLLLPDKEIKVKHAEFEQRHYEYCSVNAELCQLWPEVYVNQKNDCQRFLGKMFSSNRNFSLVTTMLDPVSLRYLEINFKDSGTLNPVVVNAIECQLPQPVRARKNVNFIRAPSYPDCVFFIIQKKFLGEYFYIVEEICDTVNQKISLYAILLENEQDTKHKRRIEPIGFESSENIKEYENIHFQNYLTKQTEYERWPELKEMDTKSYCQAVIKHICPRIVNQYEIEKLTTVSESVALKYTTIRKLLNTKIPPSKVKALVCLFSERIQQNQFRFIRTHKPNCVYWIRRKYRERNVYFIAREFCKDGAPFPIRLKLN